MSNVPRLCVTAFSFMRLVSRVSSFRLAATATVVTFAVGLTTGCEDEELKSLKAELAQQEEQREEFDNRVKSLHLEIKEKDMTDPTEEIAALAEQVTASDAQIVSLQADLEDLEKESKTALKNLSAYKAKYRLRTP